MAFFLGDQLGFSQQHSVRVFHEIRGYTVTCFKAAAGELGKKKKKPHSIEPDKLYKRVFFY